MKQLFLTYDLFEIDKPAEKQLSKKEQKAKEDAEFEALMAEVGVKGESKKEEKKAQPAAASSDANAKNKKKKEAKKAKAAAAQKEEKKEEVK